MSTESTKRRFRLTHISNQYLRDSRELVLSGYTYYDSQVGTAAAHLWLGLRYAGILPEVNINNEEGDAVWRFCYTAQ
jgi:hypothetical protein